MSLIKLFKQLPFQLVLSITTALLLGKKLCINYVSFFYTLSSCMIEILVLILPIIVFSLIITSLMNVKQGAFLLLLLIFISIICSNCLALTIAYFFSKITLPFFNLYHNHDFATKFVSTIKVLFQFNFAKLIRAEQATLFAIFCGIALNFLDVTNHFRSFAYKAVTLLSDKVNMFLTKIFIPLLPIYVFGFCIKLSYEGTLIHLFYQYGKIFLLSVFLVTAYIFILYLIGSKGNIFFALKNIKIMLPAGLTAFSTMSSAASMPVTIKCTAESTNDKNFSDLIISSTANIHMLGDDLTIVITAMTLLSIFGLQWPDFTTFIPFIIAFTTAKLSCVGLPGASVIVILPVLQTYLSFTPEMLSVFTTIYILQDSFGSMANVMGNGAFALIVQKLFKNAAKIISFAKKK